MATTTTDEVAFARLTGVLQSVAFQNCVTALVLLNALSMAAQTYPAIMAWANAVSGISVESLFHAFDWVVIVFFCLEVAARVLAQGRSFFKEGWNWLDALSSFGSLLGQSPAFAVLRVLRLVRIVRRFHSLRLIVELLIKSVSGCFSITLLMLFVLFIFALLGHVLYADTNPELFGELHTAMYTLFRITNFFQLEDVAVVLVKNHPNAYFFLVPYNMLMAFVVIGFFAALMIFYIEDLDFDGLLNEMSGKTATSTVSDTTLAHTSTTLQLSDTQCASLLQQIQGVREDIERLKSQHAQPF